MKNKYLGYLNPLSLFAVKRTKEILHVNPTASPERAEPTEIVISVFDYNAESVDEKKLTTIEDCFSFKANDRITWINIDGLRKADIEKVCEHFGVHALLVEDILSIGQRPKTDEVDGVLFCLLNMLYFNDETKTVEVEQISMVLGKDFVLSIQEEAERDAFDPLRAKIRLAKSNIRQNGADYLLYCMLDMIVDNYYAVMEKLGEQIEVVEEEVLRTSSKRSLARINQMRKELIVLKRNISPVRELVNGIIRSESDLLEDKNTKYFKDVYDHIIQAFDLTENYRDMMTSMQDLYINNVNLRMNEVMKVMAIVTCLLAPATVIGGIFGMNFDIIPYAHQHWGFYVAVISMFVIPLWMLWMFRKRGWF